MTYIAHPAVTLSVKISPRVRDKLAKLANVTGQTKSLLTAKAIQQYADLYAWQVKETRKALKRSNSKNAKFAEHDKVVAWLSSWGTKKELEPPECE